MLVRYTLYSVSKIKKDYLEADRGISAETCGLDDVFSADNLCSEPYAQFII